MDNWVKYNHDSSRLVIHLLGKILFGTKLFTFLPFPHLSHLLDWKTVICKWGELSSSTLWWRACWPVTPWVTALGIKCHQPITELNSPIPVHFSSLIPRMSTFTLALLFDHLQFALIHGPTIPGSYAILLFIASDLASIISHIHSWVLLLLWLHPFILSGVISPLISSSILCTYWPGEFLFQYPIILLFHTVHGVLKARILKWFAVPFSSGPHSVRILAGIP